MTAILLLAHGEPIEMRTGDNRRLVMRCSKTHGDAPAVDLLPHVRYVLRVTPTPAAELERTWALFLDVGLLLRPLYGIVDDASGTSDRHEDGRAQCAAVVALNLSDKVVRLVGGVSLLDPGCCVCPPPFGARSSAATQAQRSTSSVLARPAESSPPTEAVNAPSEDMTASDVSGSAPPAPEARFRAGHPDVTRPGGAQT